MLFEYFFNTNDLLERKNWKIKEQDDKLILKIEVPGMTKKDLSIEVDQNILNISGEIEDFSIKRKFTLSDEIDIDKIKATVENGILTMDLPKTTIAKKRIISIL